MAQNYTRQSSFSDGDTITSSLFNNEYNQIVNAFTYSSSSDSSTGHKHDGNAGQGGNIPQIGDIDFNNKIVVDGTNNRWGVFVEVSGSAVEQIRIQDGGIVPVTDSDVDLGTSSLYFKAAYIDAITTTGNVAVGGNLTVTGTTTFNGGTITMGDAATDNVVFGANVDSHIIPDDDGTYDLGSSTQEWKDIYIDGTAYVDAINFNGTAITATAAELNILDGVTSTAAELNILDGVTSTAAELNILDGVTSTAAELNILDGVTATATELNLIDGVTATTAELNILDGVTATATEINLLDGVTSTTAELNILDGVTSTAAELNLLDGKAFLDEDNMASNSATGIASQQSIKAYVDAQITAEDLDITTDSGTIAIDLDSETLTVSGGTGLDSSATGNAVTLAIDSTVATLTGSQTLTNKSLTAPTLTGTSTVASLDISGDIDVDGTTNLDVVDIDGAVDMASTLKVGTRLGVGVAAHASAALNITTTNQHIRFNNGSELAVIDLDSDGELNIWSHGDGEVINLKTGSGSPTTILKVDNTGIQVTGNIANASGNMTLDAAGEIKLDTVGGIVRILETGGEYGMLQISNSDFIIRSMVSDKDLIFKGNDSGSVITALTLDMSDGGEAYFAKNIHATSAFLTTANNDPQLTLISTDADASVGPILKLYRNSASPADGDVLGRIQWSGEDDAGNDSTFARLTVTATDVSNGAETAKMVFAPATSDAFPDALTLTGDGAAFNDDLFVGSTITGYDDITGGAGLAIGDGSDTTAGIMIRTGGTGTGRIYFGDNSGNAAGRKAGRIEYSHSAEEMTVFSTGSLILDSVTGVLDFDDNGTNIGRFENSSSNFKMESRVQDKDIVFVGNDGGVGVTALTLDMSAAGAATFNAGVTANPSGGVVTLGANGHITSKQSLDVTTAGGRYIGSSNRGVVGQIKIEQTATGADGGYIEFDTCSNGSTTPTTRMLIDESGNVGIGVTPEAWDTYKVLQIGNGAIVNYSPTHDMRMVSNAYYDSGWKYAESDGACNYLQDANNSAHRWEVAASGTADAAITWSQAMTLDASGNLLVGTTSTSIATTSSETGTQISDGGISIAANNPVAQFNRISSNGAIVNLRKDGSTIGSLASYSSTMQVGQGNAYLKFANATDTITPANGNGTDNDAALSLGKADARFSSLFLSGGVYLGGTAAANSLDDYEEGTWTPVLRGSSTAGTPSVGTLYGSYVKIGKLVTLTLRVTNLTLSGGSGAIQITGIPFTATTAGSNYGSAAFSMTNNINFDGDKNQNWYMGSSYMLGLESQGGGGWADLAVTNASAIYIHQTITYEEA